MKKATCLILVLTLLLGIFSACGSDSQPKASSTAAQTPSAEGIAVSSTVEPLAEPDTEPDGSAVEDESAESAEESVAEAVPAGDRPTVSYPLTEDISTLTYWVAWPPFLNSISEIGDALIFEQLEEITHVHLDITSVSTETAADDFMLRCASNDLTDMAQGVSTLYTGGGTKAIEDEILMDLVPLLDEYSEHYYNMIHQDESIYRTVLNDEGQIPAYVGMYTEPYYTDQGYWIRKDILEDVGKEMPTTVDELEDVLAAFKDHGLSDGLVVLYTGMCELMARAYDANNKVEDGTAVYKGLSDDYKDFMIKMNEFYEKGYINQNFASYTWSDTKPPQEVVFSDMAGIFNEDVASIAGYYNTSNNPNFELEALPQIRRDKDMVLDTGFIPVIVADKYNLSITTSCEKPELAVQYMDYLYSDDGFILSNYGVEGVTYTVENGEYHFTDLILNNESGFDWQLCQNLYINPGFPCLTDLSIQKMTYNDAQKNAVDTWAAAYDSSEGTLPNERWLSYTTEESQKRQDIQNDINTYIEEMRLKFITGQADIEAEWDNYCSTLESMGYYELEKIDQAAYERYINK